MLIAFSGVDCAGKSTQIRLLEQYFISRGKTCKVLWYRPGYSGELQICKNKARQLANILRRTLHPSHTASHLSSSSNRATPPASVWVPMAAIDTCLQWGLKLRLLMRRYDVVICDRYVEDACFDIRFKYPDFHAPSVLFAHLKHLMPRPDHAFILTLDHDEMLARVARKNEPFPDDEAVRDARYRLYMALPGCHIDAGGSIQHTHDLILDALELPHESLT